jgi:hypothetical protein
MDVTPTGRQIIADIRVLCIPDVMVWVQAWGNVVHNSHHHKVVINLSEIMANAEYRKAHRLI